MRRLPILLCALLWLAPAGAGETVRVAVASNFLATLKPLAAEFEARHGAEVVISSASTGKLYAQIRQGAPFDVFLAADRERPALLEQAGLTVPGSRFTYSEGRLVLWSRDPALAAGPAALDDGRIDRLAIANSKTAPYGAAAVETLERLGLWRRWEAQVVRGENVSQTLQFAATGNVDAAFVALSQVQDPAHRGQGSLWIVPQEYYGPIEQQAVLLASAAERGAAKAFHRFLRSPAARRKIESGGYRLP